MQIKLPKTNQEYKAILKEYWGLDIDMDEIKGRYSISKNGTLGFFTNCTTIDGKKLNYPEEKFPLRILIWGNSLKNLKNGNIYRFKVQFATLEKRIEINPFLLVTQKNSIINEDSINLENNRSFNIPKENNEILSLSSVIKDIYNEKLNQNNPNNVIDIAEAVEALSIDIYSENKRFIYELIQNADDAAIIDQSELKIEIKSGFVVLSHNGKPFDEKDLRGLCGIGRGTKKNDDTKTGYKGIGFKSVFGQQAGVVYVKTNDLLFRFDRNYIVQNGWNTRWGIQSSWESTNQIKFKSPWQLIPLLSESTSNEYIDEILDSEEFTVKTAIKIQNENELHRDINELFSDAIFLLFLRKISKVTLIYEGQNLCIEKRSDENTPSILSLYKNGENISNWYLRTGNYEIPSEIKLELQQDFNSPKKLQEMTRAELSFAFKLEADLKSIILLPKSESFIFTYLPTSVSEFEFPFLVNSNFLIDAGREKLHKDRIWNKWLFKVIGWELVKCCAEFATLIDLKKDYLKILITDYLSETDPLKKWFNDGLKIGFEKVPFILNNDNQLVKLSDVIIDEVAILNQDIIPVSIISEFINSSLKFEIAEQNILHEFADLGKLKNFGAKAFSSNNLKDFLQSNIFLSNHSIDSNYNLLKYLKNLDNKDFSGEWNSIIRKNTFIFSQNNKLEKISLVCFPVSTFVTDFGEGNTLIQQDLYNSFSEDSELIEWMKSFGVKPPSEIAYLEKEIIGKIDSVITEENFLELSEFIFKVHFAKELKEIHYNALRDLPLKTNKGWSKAKDCFLSNPYNPTIDFPTNIEGLIIVSDEYIGTYNAYDWKTLFVAIDVVDDINILTKYKIQKTDNEFEDSYFTTAVDFGKEEHKYPRLVNTDLPNNYPAFINYFSFFAKTTQFKFSLIFWERLFSKFNISIEPNQIVLNSYGPNREAKCFKLNSTIVKSIDFMRWGYYENNRVCIPSFIFWFLENKKCIPTNQKSCFLASEVFTNSDKIIELGGEYIPIIQVSKMLSFEWVQFIGLKSKLTINDILQILSSLSKDLNNKGYFKRDNIKRVGLLYNEIIENIQVLTFQEKQEINDWSVKNKFLCNDFVFRKKTEVIWLRIKELNEYNDKIPSVLIPQNMILDDRTEQLFLLFGISIVDKCAYEVNQEKEDIGLLIKILEILPALSLILQSRMRIKEEKEFLTKTYNRLEAFKLFICKEIILMLNYGEVEVLESKVKYYLTESAFYFTKNWQNPLERFNISHYLASLLKCKGLEQEIQLFLELSNKQLYEYLETSGYSLELIECLDIYTLIQEKIKLLKTSININNPGQSISSTQNDDSDVGNALEKDERQTPIKEEDNEENEQDFFKEVEEFISELESTEWANHIPELKNILELSKSHPKEKQKLYNLIAKLRLAKSVGIQFDIADENYNQLMGKNKKYFVHSARGSFAYIHTNEILRMREDGFIMVLDFGSGAPIKYYKTAEEILSLNTSHLLAYQYKKSMEDLFEFCHNNRGVNKHLLIIDRVNSKEKSKDIFKLLNPDDDY